MQDFEKLGVFYLGRERDPETGRSLEDLVLYDAQDLTTHAVCIGMTGSGKTGLCLTLLEEAMMDQIPVIAIDPKGDIGNLLLTFPQLDASSFAPWVDEDEARRQGQTLEQLAESEAERWRTGLAASGQSGERIGALREKCELAIYTPGGTAGRSISILHFLKRPDEETLADAELLAERATSAATSILSLAASKSACDPGSREHVLLSTLFTTLWLPSEHGGQAASDFSLSDLVGLIQKPPMTSIGALDLETFYPAKERAALALKLNSVLASPGFANWLEGEPLDCDSLFWNTDGKPRVSIFSVSHLNDDQRMFFVTLMCNQLISWMRRKSGTRSLRAIFYMDEIFGYFPPVANPPSKNPLLTLLKQARAFGLGLVLATQNPVDLDYKGLSNTGTWFIGRLQTEQDKERVLDGLTAASQQSAAPLDRARLSRVLSGLAKRNFYMHNVHEDRPVVFETRFTMSYLRGPLTREHIKKLRGKTSAQNATDNAKATAVKSAERPKPVVAPDLSQFYIPEEVASFNPQKGEWCPFLFASAAVRFVDNKSGVDTLQQRSYLVSVDRAESALPVDFSRAREIKVNLAQIPLTVPQQDSGRKFDTLPLALTRAAAFKDYQRDFALWLANSCRHKVLAAPSLGLKMRTDESERDFKLRVNQTAVEKRDNELNALRERYRGKTAQLDERIRRAQERADLAHERSKRSEVDTAIAIGATVLGAMMGRRGSSNIGRATTAARSVSKAAMQKADLERAGDNLAVLDEKLRELNEAFENEAHEIAGDYEKSQVLSVDAIAPKKSEISVTVLGIAWVRG